MRRWHPTMIKPLQAPKLLWFETGKITLNLIDADTPFLSFNNISLACRGQAVNPRARHPLATLPGRIYNAFKQ